MSDLHDVLDRKVRQYRPSEDASFEKLIDRAERRHRNRRITSGVVALAVAIAGSLGAYGMLSGGAKTRLAASNYTGIWPQTTIEEAQIAQTRSNQGDPGFVEQLDAERFLFRFAGDGLAWMNVSLTTFDDTEAAGSGPLTAAFRGCPIEAAEHPGTDIRYCEDGDFRTANVTIERLVQRDTKGLWIVTAVEVDGAQPSMQPSAMPPPASPGAGDPEPGEAPAESQVWPEVRDFVASFIRTRSEGAEEAREHLSEEAAAAYDSNEGGLKLYGYESDGGASSWEIVDITVRPNTDRWDVILKITGTGLDFPESGTIYEKLLVGSPGDGATILVLSAERTE